MREEFETKRDRYQLSKPKKYSIQDEEDELDDLLNEKQAAIDEQIRKEAERLAAKFEDCDFADIDAILETKAEQEEQKGVAGEIEKLDDDQLDDIISSLMEKKKVAENEAKR